MTDTPAIRALLRRDESYAIHALIAILETPGIHAAAIAERLEMPRAYMSKVLRRLVETGLIESRMGRSGGVFLAVDPETLSLLQIVEAVSGPLVLDTCQTELRCVTQRRTGRCKLNRAFVQANLEIRSLLDGIHLADLGS